MNDGTYRIDVTLAGGSGKASVSSPSELTVADGAMTARIEWSSPHYDLMIVDGDRYLPVNTEGNSVFLIPVAALDASLDVQAETVAMSEPHLIEYQLTFDPGTLRQANREAQAQNTPLTWLIAGAVVLVLCAAAAFAAVLLTKRKGGKRA